MLALVEQAAGKLGGDEQQEWLDTLVQERQSIRTALRWFVEQGEAEPAARVAVGTWWAAYLLGRYGEPRSWLEEVLRVPGELPAALRAEALVAVGTLAHLQGDAEVAETRLQEGFTTYREAGDRSGEAMELNWRGGVAMRRGDYAEARRLGERCVELWRELGDESKVSRALDFQGMRELQAGELDRAEVLAREARIRYERDGDGEGLGWVTMLLGAVAHYWGDRLVAHTLLTEARRRSEANSQTATLAWSLQLLGHEARRDGDLDRRHSGPGEGDQRAALRRPPGSGPVACADSVCARIFKQEVGNEAPSPRGSCRAGTRHAGHVRRDRPGGCPRQRRVRRPHLGRGNAVHRQPGHHGSHHGQQRQQPQRAVLGAGH